MKKKILVIEDDAESARLLSRLMPEYEVRFETDGVQAVAAALEFGPDVVLLDLIMPGAYGLEVAVQLQSQERLTEVPIIIVSGFVKPSGAHSPSVVSGFPAVSKPIDLPALKEMIEQETANAGSRV